MDYQELEKMTVIKLREEAKKFPDVKGVSGMKKEELLRLLVEKLGIETPEKKKRSPEKPRDKRTLKSKITELKAEREAARAAKDSNRATLLRRRIHSLKRQVRKLD